MMVLTKNLGSGIKKVIINDPSTKNNIIDIVINIKIFFLTSTFSEDANFIF